MSLVGYCECGCGQRTGIAQRTGASVPKGRHFRYVFGHHAGMAGPDYIEEDRGYTTPCWIWQRGLNLNGYGRLGRTGPATQLAHRWYYEARYGPVPDGRGLDHLCRNRDCVNPEHLEPVTAGENTRRSPHTKLTVDRVQAIRDEHAAGASLRGLARKYGMSYSGLRHAVVGVNWKDAA